MVYIDGPVKNGAEKTRTEINRDACCAFWGIVLRQKLKNVSWGEFWAITLTFIHSWRGIFCDMVYLILFYPSPSSFFQNCQTGQDGICLR